jgi:phenylalanyl-tRNA synthetase alpha chain
MVTQWENFSSVNIPPTHPATEMHDTLYIDQQDENGKPYLMRTHTSAHQVELIQKYGLPCKFVIPGKVYRNEKMDASHDCVFWQVEGVVIDKGISIAHFKQMMQQILSAILEQEVEMRIRPAYFPFVEPGFEIDAKTMVGKHEKWLEILGAGMIHPQVLENAGVDPNEYSGFAF